MVDAAGHIELERSIDSITIGVRHRKDLGDIAGLARSIDQVGLLQPITITPDGILVCGLRRLAAVRSLGWRSLKVWVRSGISDGLSRLLAERLENVDRKQFSGTEAEALYREIKQLEAEEAAQREAVHHFGPGGKTPGRSGSAESADPLQPSGDSRRRAAELVTGNASYTRLEQIGWLKDVANDTAQPPTIRDLATQALDDIDHGRPVNPAYKRVCAAIKLATLPNTDGAAADVADTATDMEDELGRRAAEALERVRAQARSGKSAPRRGGARNGPLRTLRSFVLTWTELEGWSQQYDVDEIAQHLSTEEWNRFERVVAESIDFADRVRKARRAATSLA